MPYLQHAYNGATLSLVIRTTNEPTLLAETVRRKAQELSPSVPLRFTTLKTLTAQNVAEPHHAHVEAHRHARRRARLIAQLPERFANWVHWLLKPESRWARLPAGLLLILGGCLAILPVLGLWMLPLGVILIAEDIPAVRRQVEKALDWMERRWPRWFPQDDRTG